MKNQKFHYLGITAGALTTLLTSPSAQALVNPQIAFQGVLRQSSTSYVADGSYCAQVIVKRDTTQLWSKNISSFSVSNGVFSIVLSGADNVTGSSTNGQTLASSMMVLSGATQQLQADLKIDYSASVCPGSPAFTDTFSNIPIYAVPVALVADKAVSYTGSVGLTQLAAGGATTGQFLSYDGANWVAANAPSSFSSSTTFSNAVTITNGTNAVSIGNGTGGVSVNTSGTGNTSIGNSTGTLTTTGAHSHTGSTTLTGALTVTNGTNAVSIGSGTGTVSIGDSAATPVNIAYSGTGAVQIGNTTGGTTIRGTAAAGVSLSNGVTIGSGGALVSTVLRASQAVTMSAANIPANGQATGAVTVTGATKGNMAICNPHTSATTNTVMNFTTVNLVWNCWVSATNVVTIRVHNAATTVATGTTTGGHPWSVMVIQ